MTNSGGCPCISEEITTLLSYPYKVTLYISDRRGKLFLNIQLENS